MPLSRKLSVAAAVETAPGVAVAPLAADVVDARTASQTFVQNFQEREPSGGTLSRTPTAPTTSEGSQSIEIDVQGSGTATTLPPSFRFLTAGLAVSEQGVTIALATLTVPLFPGDTLTGQTSGAVLEVLNYVPTSGSLVHCRKLDATAVTDGEAFDSGIFGDGGGGGIATADTPNAETAAQNRTIRPVSDQTQTVALAGSWSSSDPAVGEGITVKTAVGVTVGEALFVDQDGTTLTLELIWGDVPDSASLESTNSSGGATTASVAASANLTQVQGQTLTIDSNRDRLRKRLVGARCSTTISADAGAAATLNVTAEGQPATPVQEARLNATLSASTAPRFQAVSGARGAFHINGVPMPIKSWTFDPTNQLGRIADGNAPKGQRGGLISGRDPQITCQIEQGSLEEVNIWELMEAGTTVVVGIQIGENTGNRVSILARAAQITAIGDDEADGVATHSLTLELRTPGSGDDEWIVAHT